MKILVVTQYFFPETFIINDLVIEMERQGHEVTVFTGKPNYPDGKIFPGYQVNGVQSEKYGDAIEVIRVPLWLRGRGGAKNLILNYLTFAFSASVLGPWLLRKRKFDVIFVFEPSPITVAIPAIFFKLFKRVPVFLWVQDLWPQSLVVTKFIKNSLLLKIVEILVWFIYKGCDKILVQSRSFIEPIQEISPTSRPVYYPNSYRRMTIDQGLQLTSEVEKVFRDHFTVVFAGNIGKAQSVDTIVAAANKVKDIKDLKIVFVGSGSMLPWIQDQIKAEGMENIECLGRFDMSYMPLIYSKSKVLLLTLNSDEILKFTLPWKAQAYLAAGKPVLGAIDGEGMRMINESGCGFVGPAEDAEALADNIRKIHALSESQREQLGRKGQDYFEKNFEMVAQVRKLTDLFATHCND